MIPKVIVQIIRQPNERLSAFVVQESSLGAVRGSDMLEKSSKITNLGEAQIRVRSQLSSLVKHIDWDIQCSALTK